MILPFRSKGSSNTCPYVRLFHFFSVSHSGANYYGYYYHNLTTNSGDVELKMQKLKGITFETEIIKWYCRQESSIEEALIEMYLAEV